MAQPGQYDQDFNFIDFLYDEKILEQVLVKPKSEGSPAQTVRGQYPEVMEDQKPFLEQRPEGKQYERSYVVSIELLPEGYEDTSAQPMEYIMEEPETPTSIVPYVGPPPLSEPDFLYSIRGVQFTSLDPTSNSDISSTTSTTSYTSDDRVQV